jgi:2'-5' RNA ligase
VSWFVGIGFDDPTCAGFSRALELARPLHPGLKWEKPEKAHLTLVFCAEVKPDEARIVEVAARHAPFSLRLRGLGAFKRHVLWLGVEGDLDPLRALQAELTQAVDIVDEHGQYAPHVTLARGRLNAEPKLDFVSEPFRVARVTLFESRGGKYAEQLHAPLSGTRAR